MNYSKRQTEVLNLLVKGFSNLEIALELGISGDTANLHVYKLFKKMGVNSRGQAVAMHLASIKNTDLEDSAAELVTWLKSLGVDIPLVDKVDGAIKARLAAAA